MKHRWQTAMAKAGLALGLVGCVVHGGPPPGLADAALGPAESVWSPDRGTRVICYQVDRSLGKALLPDLAAARADVADRLGLRPPRAEVVIFSQEATPVASATRETRADLAFGPAGWSVRFGAAVDEQDHSRSVLIALTAHEVAEGSIVSHVTVLDPFVRWLHDGVADLIEEEVLSASLPQAADALLRNTSEVLEDAFRGGARWADLTRWRQLSSQIIRSHRFFGPDAEDLSLDDPAASLARVQAALGQADDPVVRGGLQELEAMVSRAQAIQERPWAVGEARPDDPILGDVVFYALSLAVWLELEESRPGIARATAQAIAQRRTDHDHVISADEVLVIVRRLAGDVPLPPLARYPLVRGLKQLQAARKRLRDGASGG